MKQIRFAELQIDGVGPMQTIQEMSIDDDHTEFAVKHSMRRDPGGLTYTVGGQQVSGSWTVIDTVPEEIDFEAWKANGDERLVTYEDVPTDGGDGPRFALRNVRIQTISPSRALGDNTKTVTWMALKREREL